MTCRVTPRRAAIAHAAPPSHPCSPAIPAPLSVIPAPLSAIPAQAGTRAVGAACPNFQTSPSADAAQVGRRSIAAHACAGGRPHSCLRRNDGSDRNDGKGRRNGGRDRAELASYPGMRGMTKSRRTGKRNGAGVRYAETGPQGHCDRRHLDCQVRWRTRAVSMVRAGIRIRRDRPSPPILPCRRRPVKPP